MMDFSVLQIFLIALGILLGGSAYLINKLVTIRILKEEARLESENKIKAEIQINELLSKVENLEKELFKVNHQKKSSEVRLGKIGENLAPFTNGWPWDSNNFRFIGSPVDGIQFTEDAIIFVEIKTGKARLSKYQTVCKKLVTEGKVSFASFRIGENGITLIEN